MSEAKPKIVHLKREPFDVRIDRKSKWGNPFVIGRDGDRGEVIAKYRAWVINQPELMAALPELIGKRLGCWCSPFPCHGDVLVGLVVERVLKNSGPPCERCGGGTILAFEVLGWRNADCQQCGFVKPLQIRQVER